MFSDIDLKDHKKIWNIMIEDCFDPHRDSAIQPKARGLLHMECEFIAHHIKDDSGLEHLIASMQPRKYSEDYSKHLMKQWRITEALEALGNVFKSTRRL